MKQFSIILILLAFLSCGKEQKASDSSSSRTTPAHTARVTEQPGLIRIAGTIQSEDTAVIASKFAGFALRVPVRSGMQVKQGELLVLMDDRNLSAQSDRVSSMRSEAVQASEEAKNHLEAAKAQKELAAATFLRIEKLFEKKSASLQEFEEAKARRDSAEADWNAATQKVGQSAARMVQLLSDEKDVSANLSYVRIAAPFDGVVTSVEVDTGEFVNPGQTLVRVERTRNYQVVFSVGQELLPMFNEGAVLDIEIEGDDDVRFKAIVVEIGPSLSQATTTFPVKANITTEKPLRSGISAVVILPLKSQKALWIPKAFLNSKAGLETVFVRRGDQWERTLIRSGKTRNNDIEILSGLNAGDEIAVFEE